MNAAILRKRKNELEKKTENGTNQAMEEERLTVSEKSLLSNKEFNILQMTFWRMMIKVNRLLKN